MSALRSPDVVVAKSAATTLVLSLARSGYQIASFRSQRWREFGSTPRLRH
jgi:hypothetical protein